jgi:hypothetical protein
VKCMEKGMIFRRYYNWITYWLWLPNKEIMISGRTTETLYAWSYFHKNKYQWLWKILGGCVFCFGTWIFIVLYLVVSSLNQYSIPTLIGLFLGMGMNYFWIEVINKIKKWQHTLE